MQTEVAGAVSHTEKLLTFRSGERRYGVLASLVREVGRIPRLTSVPHAPPSLLGLGNFRGAVLPVLSFAGLTHGLQGNEQRVILLETASPIALAVDEVSALTSGSGVCAIDAEALAQTRSIGRKRTVGQVAAIASKVVQAFEADVPMVAFLIGAQEIALPIGAVEEILALPDKISVLPWSDPAVVGSVSVRDTLLPLLSLATLLALPDAPGETRQRIVVVRIGTHRVGLVVNAMRGVLRVPKIRIDPVPPVLTRGSAEAKIQAVCRLDGQRLVSVLAVEHLIRDDLTARLLETRDPEDMVARRSSDEAAEQFLIFSIGDTEFGLPVEAVIEVVALPAKLGKLPKAPAFVKGVMKLRGTVVPVIDQTQRFIGEPAKGARRRVVVVRIGSLSAGFVVDAVSEVRRIAVALLRAAPQVGGEETRVFDRVATLDGDARIVLIVSPQELLDSAERDLLGTISSKTSVGAA